LKRHDRGGNSTPNQRFSHHPDLFFEAVLEHIYEWDKFIAMVGKLRTKGGAE
jgi:hypothetical protein